MGKFLKFIPVWLMVASWVCATVCGTSIAQESDTAAVKARLEEVAKPVSGLFERAMPLARCF
jgi:hypothetical protein